MGYIIALSGPIAVGKSALADRLLQRFNSHRISTRQLLIDAGCPSERDALIEAGKRLDTQTGGRAARQSGWESRDNQDENAPLPG